MKRFLLDTNIVSELRKAKPHGGVLSWYLTVPPDAQFISAVTLGEIQSGIERTRKQDPAKAQELELWIDQLGETQQILSLDGVCFREWARLMTGRVETLAFDAMIAAIARIHGLTVVTRNVRDFKELRVPVLNPF
jgi:predicted nucleic acid-binding protein